MIAVKERHTNAASPSQAWKPTSAAAMEKIALQPSHVLAFGDVAGFDMFRRLRVADYITLSNGSSPVADSSQLLQN